MDRREKRKTGDVYIGGENIYGMRGVALVKKAQCISTLSLIVMSCLSGLHHAAHAAHSSHTAHVWSTC